MHILDPQASPRPTGRIEAISDGIFSIGMTLLVLDIKVPEVDGLPSLLPALIAGWPSYLAFLVGFFTLLVCWINHHYMFENIRESNGILLLLNGCKMLIVSLTPFVTALLSRYVATDSQQLVVSIYTGNFFFMGLSMTCLWCYAQAKGFTAAADPAILRTATAYYIFAAILSGMIFLVSFASVWPSLVLFVAMFGIYVFPAATVSQLVRLQSSRVSKVRSAAE